jgi:hypothetical protein
MLPPIPPPERMDVYNPTDVGRVHPTDDVI